MTDVADRNRGGRPSNLAREAVRRARLEAIVATGALEAAGAALAIIRDDTASASVKIQAATLLASLQERGIAPPQLVAPADTVAETETLKTLREILQRLASASPDGKPPLILLDRDIEDPEPLVIATPLFPGAPHDAAGAPPAAAPDTFHEAHRPVAPDESPPVPAGGWTNAEYAEAKRRAHPEFLNDARPRLSLVPLADRRF